MNVLKKIVVMALCLSINSSIYSMGFFHNYEGDGQPELHDFNPDLKWLSLEGNGDITERLIELAQDGNFSVLSTFSLTKFLEWLLVSNSEALQSSFTQEETKD